MLVEAVVYYEYAPHNFETVYGLIQWEHQQAGRVGARAKAESYNGYFSYETINAKHTGYET